MYEQLADHCVYKKDAEGTPYLIGETVHNGKIIQHPAAFCHLDYVLSNLNTFEIRENDIFITGYGKAGTHWLYEILNILLSGKLELSTKIQHQAMLEACSSFAGLEQMEDPRILQTHMLLRYVPKSILEKVKIINLIRNPKSTVVSYYHHMKKLHYYQYTGTFAGNLPVHIEGKDTLFGSWFQHVTEYWDYFKNKPNVMTVFYEDLNQHTGKVIKEMAFFLGLDHDQQFCEGLANLTSFDKMINVGESSVNSGEWKTFLRKGTIDDWKNHFTVAQNEMFDAVYREKMKDHPDLVEKIRFE